MATITKKELIDRIAQRQKHPRVLVKLVIQQFLDEVITDLARGNRLEFRDFGIFDTRMRQPRKAQNPKTLKPVAVPRKRTVKFKAGRMMKTLLCRVGGDSGHGSGSQTGHDGQATEASAAPAAPITAAQLAKGL